MNKDEARAYAIKYLTSALEAHQRGEFLSISDGHEEYDQMLIREEVSVNDLLYITLEFWASWADTAEHDWMFYPPFTKDDWPMMARILLNDLEANRVVTDETILRHFVQQPRPPRQSLLDRLKNLLKS